MTEIDSLSPTQDERLMAALSHVSALLPFMGIIAPIVIWATQKDKSRFAAFHSLQALAYQLIMVVAWFIGMGCYFCSFISIVIPISFTSASETPTTVYSFAGLAFLIPFVVFGLILIGGFVFVIYGLFGAVRVFQGKPFRYLLIGDRIERFMLHQDVGK